MSITSVDSYLNSFKQFVSYTKTASRTTVATGWFSIFDLAGNPGAGTFAGTSTTAGVVPTDATAGCPTIIDFGSGNTGYLTGVDFGCSVACRLKLFDMLYKAGAYAYNSGTTTVTSPPSYSSRIPNSNYSGTQIWIEVTTAFVAAATWTVTVNYTNQDGTAAKTTGSIGSLANANLTLGRMYMLPLAAGDTGVQKIESVTVTTGSATAGAFNVLVVRPLWSGRVRIANDGDVHDITKTAMPQIFQDSAIIAIANADSTTSGVIDMELVIANG